MSLSSRTLYLAFLCGLIPPVSSPARAAEAITVAEYIALKKEKNFDDLVPYLSGAADALWSANVMLRVSGQSPLYCPKVPTAPPLSATELMTVIDKVMPKLAGSGELRPEHAITTVAAESLMRTMPCR